MTATFVTPLVALGLCLGHHRPVGFPVAANIAAAAPVKAPDTKHWIGRTLVRRGESPPKTGRFVLETEIPAPYQILTPGMASDTVFISDRLTIFVDPRMTILRIDKG